MCAEYRFECEDFKRQATLKTEAAAREVNQLKASALKLRRLFGIESLLEKLLDTFWNRKTGRLILCVCVRVQVNVAQMLAHCAVTEQKGVLCFPNQFCL